MFQLNQQAFEESRCIIVFHIVLRSALKVETPVQAVADCRGHHRDIEQKHPETSLNPFWAQV